MRVTNHRMISLAGDRIATGGNDHTVRVWDLASEAEQVRAAFDSDVTAVALSGSGTTLAVGAYAGRGMSIEALQYLDATRVHEIGSRVIGTRLAVARSLQPGCTA